MKIRSIYAKNVFNFGPQGIEWKDIPDRSILVGPNGSGKTNIFRLLTLVADSFLYSTRLQHPEVENRLSEIFRRGDSEARIEFELADDEVTAICDWLTLAAFGQVQDFRHYWQTQIKVSADPNAIRNTANEPERVVRKILKESADSFKMLIGNSITLVIMGTGNPRDPARQYAIVRSDDPRLFSTTRYSLTTDLDVSGGPVSNKGPISYIQVKFLEFIWERFKEFSPEAAKRGSSESALNDGDIAKFVKVQGIDWLQIFSSQNSQEAKVIVGLPITFSNLNTVSGEESIPLIQILGDFLKSRNYTADSIGLLDLIGLIFRGSIIHVSEIRARPFNFLVTGHHTSSDKTLTLDGSGLAPFLLWMKNGRARQDRERFLRLRESFREVCRDDLNFEFDIAVYDEAREEGTSPAPNLISEVRFVDLNSKVELSADDVPGSIIETLTLLTSVALAGAKGGVLLLDEPSLNLHPTMQRKLSKYILEESHSGKFQLLMITHSPNFITVDETLVGSIVRISRIGGGSVLHIPDLEHQEQNPSQISTDLNRYPQLRSALFARKVILLEGYDEEAAYPVWFEKCDGEANFAARNVIFVNCLGVSLAVHIPPSIPGN